MVSSHFPEIKDHASILLKAQFPVNTVVLEVKFLICSIMREYIYKETQKEAYRGQSTSITLYSYNVEVYQIVLHKQILQYARGEFSKVAVSNFKYC